jgi:hypothetical protein
MTTTEHQLASGAIAIADETGRVVEILQPEPYFETCECEQDWNCPMHGGTNRPTWIETRYSYADDGEPWWAI